MDRLVAWALRSPLFRGLAKRLLWYPRKVELNVTPTHVKVGKNGSQPRCLLQFGIHSDHSPGYQFDARIQLRRERHSGHVQFVQDIVMDRRKKTFAGPEKCLTTNGVRMLDDADPYYEEFVSGRGPHPVLNSDSPSNPLMGAEILEITEQYRMFLMWRPARFGGRLRAPSRRSSGSGTARPCPTIPMTVRTARRPRERRSSAGS